MRLYTCVIALVRVSDRLILKNGAKFLFDCAGTTGKAKGVEVRGFLLTLIDPDFDSGILGQSTHRNITSVIDQVRPGLPDLGPKDTLIGVLPFYHIYGELARSSRANRLPIEQGAIKLLHFPFRCGTPVVIMNRFDPVQFCANIEKYRVTIAFIVPPVLVVLARHPGE
jgi:acyl-CoA synthetase (AMP-forming)/AMP-acid ligase II